MKFTMHRRFSRAPFTLLLLLLVSPSAHAQLDTGPFPRFMGDNYNNGLSTYSGPTISNPVFTATATAYGQSVPSVASNGKVVIAGAGANGYVDCFSSTGSLIWTTQKQTNPTFASTYGTPTNYPPAIGKEGTVDVVYVTTYTSGGPAGIVALKLNAAGPGPSVKWSYIMSTGFPSWTPYFSPVVGPDGTVYTAGGNLTDASGDQKMYAFQSGTLKWTWGGPGATMDGTNIASQTEPILWTDGTNNYILLCGIINIGPQNGFYTNTIRVLVIKDSGTSGILEDDFKFPLYFKQFAGDHYGEYTMNGDPSLSPDGGSLIIPWCYSGTSVTGNEYGIACLSFSGGVVNGNWPSAIFTNPAYDPPPSSFVDATITNGSNPYHYCAAIDSSGVYSTNALGTAMFKRDLSTGNLDWTTSLPGGAIAGADPALDSNNKIWITGHASSVFKLDTSTGNPTTFTNTSYTIFGDGLAIGYNSNVWMAATTTDGTNTKKLLRLK